LKEVDMDHPLKIITKSPKETKDLGFKIGKILKKRDVLILVGELGSGKTTFVQGVAKGLKVSDCVCSPSFTIVNEYQKKTPLYHIDLYRLEKEEEIISVGIEEYLYGEGITVIEWGERVKDLISNFVEINFSFVKENIRSLEFTLYGEKTKVEGLKKVFGGK